MISVQQWASTAVSLSLQSENMTPSSGGLAVYIFLSLRRTCSYLHRMNITSLSLFLH